MQKPESLAIAQESIKRAIREIEWWKLVHKDVSLEIAFLIDHIDKLGLLFRDAFPSACMLTQQKRKIHEANSPAEELSLIFGSKLSEEVYQSAKATTVHLLGLDAWFEPTEADVQACRLICDHIDVLESFDLLKKIELPVHPLLKGHEKLDDGKKE